MSMQRRIQLRLAGLSSRDWRGELVKRLAQSPLTSTVELPQERTPQESGSAAAADPAVLAALIIGGSAVVVALIPVLVDIFRRRRPEARDRLVVVLHGTADSSSLALTGAPISEEVVQKGLTQIGSITGIEIRIQELRS